MIIVGEYLLKLKRSEDMGMDIHKVVFEFIQLENKCLQEPTKKSTKE